jgi:hypothetical protein
VRSIDRLHVAVEQDRVLGVVAGDGVDPGECGGDVDADCLPISQVSLSAYPCSSAAAGRSSVSAIKRSIAGPKAKASSRSTAA